ncbi:MAG: dihydroorotase [Cohaesibacteraceae bacterium]|nr:dihydroorotase [Cohaesibacteraceae bacterium]
MNKNLNGNNQSVFIRNARIVDPASQRDETGHILIENGFISELGPDISPPSENLKTIDATGLIASPGLVDMRVFTGEPGEEHRETLASASRAAAAGGVTTMIVMPDTDPVIDDIALVDFILRRARDTAIVNIHPMAAMTRGLEGDKMTEFGLMQEAGAVAFTNGRKPVTNALTMRRALTYAKDFNALISHMPQDPDLSGNGVMNEGETASRLGLPGIPAEAETIMVARDVRLARLTRGRYHAAQISCNESIDVIRRAKDQGDNITCATSINHATLNENDIGLYRTFFKLAPPLRHEDDRMAIVQAIADGTIDVITSSHDPQDVDTKRNPFAECADGAIGLETLLAAGLRLVHNEDLTLIRLIEVMSTTPANLLGLPAGRLQSGSPADIVLFDLNFPWMLQSDVLMSRSKNTAFENARFTGKVMHTLVAGECVYSYDKNN